MICANGDVQDRAVIQTERKKTTDAKWYRRLKVVDLSGQGQAVPELAQMFDLSAATIRRSIHCYNNDDLTSLRPANGRGRPPLLNWTKDQLLDVLAQSPADIEQLITAAQSWTQALPRQYLETCHKVEVTQTTISKALRRVGIRWRRAKRRLRSPDPLYVVKRQRVEQLRQMALAGNLTNHTSAWRQSDEPPKAAYLAYLDSTDRHWNPDISATYGLAGRQWKVDSPGLENPRYARFSSLIFPSGESLYGIHQRKRAAALLEHLQLLIELDPVAFCSDLFPHGNR